MASTTRTGVNDMGANESRLVMNDNGDGSVTFAYQTSVDGTNWFTQQQLFIHTTDKSQFKTDVSNLS